MTLLQIFILSSVCCLLSSVNGIVHYGVEPDLEKENPEGEAVQILHSHGHRHRHSGSSSGSSSESSSGSDSSSSSGSDSSSSSGSDSSSSEGDSDDSDFLIDDSLLEVRFTAFGDPVQVSLKRVNSQLAGATTPVWLAEGSDAGNITFTRAHTNALGKAVRLYQDRGSGSSVLLIGENLGDPYFLGVIAGYNIHRPPPEARKKRSVARRSPVDGYAVSDYHYVSRYSRRRRAATLEALSTIESRRRRDVNNETSSTTIYPEILVATDYDLGITSTTSEEFYDHLIYVLAFFNGVDLLFQDISSPEIRLHIAGIVVNANRAAVPYIHNNIRDDGSINGRKAAEDAGPFYFGHIDSSEFPAGSYDVVVTMTNTYVCDAYEADICTPLITGVSTIHPVCQNNYPVVNMSAIIEDDLAFSGTRIAGHELGHILGAGHDGDEDEGGGDCDFHDGYIMSRYNVNSTVSLKWSACSKASLREELSNATADCLRNPPDWKKDGEKLPPILPGNLKGTNAQCQNLGYVRSCLGPNICNALQCTHDPFLSTSNCKKVGEPAAQGAYCGFNHHCINGDCVPVESSEV
ncbi:A disintegrin and metalloproteinase with thrombospondin motifs like [Diachasmimorpha longicaudata]|uniref:A disintegrin and metalloproteinase with thrombospondin motifs like n=1 Tax=Diachasmimorpha longicaudata TaxID=58733 RepID=UPI0030B881FA